MDSDIIVNTDIKELYYYNLKDKAVGAVQDLYWSYVANRSSVYSEETGRFHAYTNYVTDYLQIDLEDYINTGVLLMDYKKLKEKGIISKSIDLIQNRYFGVLDQDVF